MSFRSVAAKNVVLRRFGVMTVAVAALFTFSLTNGPFVRAQSPQKAPPPQVRLPDESAGIDGIARTLVSAFDQADIIALGRDAPVETRYRSANRRGSSSRLREESAVHRSGVRQHHRAADPGPLCSRRECTQGSVGAGLEDHNPGRQRSLGLISLRGVSRSRPRCQFEAACRCASSRFRG